MKKVKLSFAIIMIITMLMSCMACTKKTECDYCGEMAKCKKAETLIGAEVNVCEKCATILETIQ
ncbi:MAG: hypothetical protein IKL73_07515 [Lachnospiraceae bacterium]|nr:hypothetical protein [Lachnospiraceae bacterium]